MRNLCRYYTTGNQVPYDGIFFGGGAFVRSNIHYQSENGENSNSQQLENDSIRHRTTIQ